MRLIVLAAGLGSRLRPLTENKPKCLVPIHGRPLLQWQLDVAHRVGITDITVVTGAHAEQIRAYPVRTYNNDRFDSTNMVYSLGCVEDWPSQGFILSYGDIVFSEQTLAGLIEANHDYEVVIDKGWHSYWQQRFDDPMSDAESLKLDSNHCILEIGQASKYATEVQGQYIGLMKFSAKAAAHIQHVLKRLNASDPNQYDKMYMTDFLQHLIHSGQALHAHSINRHWFEVDTIKDLEVAQSQFFNYFKQPETLLNEE